MARVKLLACAEAAPGGDWAALDDTERTHLIRMYPEAIRGTLQGMEAASRGRPFEGLTGQEIAELVRLRNSMRETFDRELGAGVAVVGAPTLLDD